MASTSPQFVQADSPVRSRRTTWETILIAVCAACGVVAIGNSITGNLPHTPATALQINVVLALALMALARLTLTRFSRQLVLAIALLMGALVALTVVPWLFEKNGLLEHSPFDRAAWSLGPFPSRSMVVDMIALAVAALGIGLLTVPRTRITSAFIWAAGIILPLAGIALASGRVDGSAALEPSSESSIVHPLLVIAVICLGAAFLLRKPAADSRSAPYPFRYRALFLLAILCGSTLLWHSLRATEWNTLQVDLRKTLSRDVTAVSRGSAERSVALQRLSWHWRDMDWQVPDSLLLKDTNAFLLSYPGLAAVLTFDEHGELQRSLGRKAQPAGDDPSPLQVAAFVGPEELTTRLGWNPRFAQAAKNALRMQRTVGSEPDNFSVHPAIGFVAVPVIDANGKAMGVLGTIVNLDFASNAIFNNVTAGYAIALSYGKTLYLTSRDTPKPKVLQRIQPVSSPVIMARLPMTVEIWPSAATLNQFLTPMPGLTLVSGWLASALLMLAWRAESRAQQLTGERQTILDRSPDVIFTLDDQDRFVTVSAASRSILKYAPEELIGRNFTELVPESNRERSSAELRAVHAGYSFAFENLLTRKDGAVIDVHWSATWSKSARLMYCVARDVSKRKKSELFEEGQRDILRMIASGNALPSILNRCARLIEDMCPGTRACVLELDHAGTLKQCSIANLPTDLQCGLQMPLKATNGEPMGALSVYWSEAHQSGAAESQTITQVGNLAAIAMERSRRDTQLTISERRMAEAQSIAHVGSWNYFPDSDLFECSEECMWVLGVQDPKLLRTADQARARVHPDDLPMLLQVFTNLSSTGRTVDVVHRVVRPNGQVRQVHSRSSFIAAEGDRPVRVFGTLQDVTEHHELEEALRSSEERYRSIATQVGAIHVEWNLISGKVSYAGAVQQLLGYTSEELQKLAFYDVSLFVHPEDIPRMRSVIKMARQNVSDWNAEYRLRHKRGNYVVVRSHGIFLRGAATEAQRMLMTAADISERKHVESLLRESEERLRIATEQSGRAVYDLDLTKRKVRWEGATDQLFGYTNREMHYMNWDECLQSVHPLDLDAIKEEIARHPPNNNASHREFRVRRKDGSVIHVESISAPQFDAQGQAYRRIGVLSDITQRRIAEDEQRRYTVQLRTLADVARKITTFLTTDELAAFLVDAVREIIGVRQAAISIAAAKPSGLPVHRTSIADPDGVLRSASPPANYAGICDMLADATHTLRFTHQELMANPYWSQLSVGIDPTLPMNGLLASRMLAGDGTSLGVLWLSDKAEGNFSDGDLQILTQLGGLAAVAIENARLLATLEQRVAQRTQDLEISNRELEAFSYSVSHDLRAPLRAIAGFSEILNNQYTRQLDDNGRRCLERITGGVQRMAELIDDLLGLARVSRADITRLQIDLSTVAATVVNRQRERHPGRNINIAIDSHMFAAADPRLLEVALDNLLENAFKFTSTRETAKIHFGMREMNGERVFFVKDNGVGFDPTYAANLFGVFQRLHSVNEFPGTGVGLAIVQRIIHRHRGTIWAEATVNGGATFFFTLSAPH